LSLLRSHLGLGNILWAASLPANPNVSGRISWNVGGRANHQWISSADSGPDSQLSLWDAAFRKPGWTQRGRIRRWDRASMAGAKTGFLAIHPKIGGISKIRAYNSIKQ